MFGSAWIWCPGCGCRTRQRRRPVRMYDFGAMRPTEPAAIRSRPLFERAVAFGFRPDRLAGVTGRRLRDAGAGRESSAGCQRAPPGGPDRYPERNLEFLDSVVFGNAVRDWLWSFGLLLLAIGAISAGRRFLGRRLTSLSRMTKNDLDDALAAAAEATKSGLLLVVAVYFATRVLYLPARFDDWVTRFAIAAVLIQVGFWAIAWLEVVLSSWKRRRWGDDPSVDSTIGIVRYAVKVVIWAIALLLLLENLGVDVSALVTGLGIGGIAVALAIQSILGDLFASLTILLDKPFVIGDSLAVDGFNGTVESIGLNSTRLTSITGEQLVFSNKDLLQSRIRNYGRMKERRILFRLGVVYGTPLDTLKEIPGMIRTAVEANETTRFDRSHFKGFGDSALEFESVFYMVEPDYKKYLDVQQSINLELMKLFAAAGIEFAYPTQHLFLETVVPGGNLPAERGGTGVDGSVDGPGDDR